MNVAIYNTKDVINALRLGHIGSFGIDEYEEEEGLFFEDHSGRYFTGRYY